MPTNSDPGAEAAIAGEGRRNEHELTCELFNAIEHGLCVIEMIDGSDGHITDCRFLKANAAFERQIVAGIVGKTMRSLAIGDEEQWLPVLDGVAKTGDPQRFEKRLGERLFKVQAFKMGGEHERRIGMVVSEVIAPMPGDPAYSENDAGFRSLAALSPDGIAIIDAAGRFAYGNATAFRLFGVESDDEFVGHSSFDFLAPEEIPKVRRRLKRILEGKKVLPIEHNVRQSDGTRITVAATSGPIMWEGKPAVEVFWRDITEKKAASAALYESELRLRTLIEGIPQLVWRSWPAGNWIWSSPQWTAYTGLSPEQSTGQGWLEALHPDDRPEALAAWRRAEKEGSFDLSYRIRRRSDGTYRWFETRAMPSRTETGEIIEWLGTSTDVDDQRQLREHERQLLYELQHRVRNSLAVIRSIVRRTADTSETVEDFASHLDGRIDAFARVQTSLTRNAGAGLDLAMMIADELASYAVREDSQFRLEGPQVCLDAKVAGTLGLAIHELATNAVKYGALSSDAVDGRIRVVWKIAGQEPALRLEWKEAGMHSLAQPSRRGFGLTLFERALPYELRAKVKMRFEADGLRCVIVAPLEPRTNSN